MAVLNEIITLVRIVNQAACFHLIRPGLDLIRRFKRAIGMQPDADFLVVLRRLDGLRELVGSDVLETEEFIVERTVIMVLTQCSREAGAALVDRTAGNCESRQAPVPC